MALKAKEPRALALTVRITESSYSALNRLCKRHNLSQADVVEALIEHEAKELKRLKRKQSRYRRK